MRWLEVPLKPLGFPVTGGIREVVSALMGVVFVISAGAPPALGQKQGTRTRVSADAVCSFIRERMSSALPQVPSFCAVENKRGYSQSLYQLSVFSPTDVLEGKMRRAWSTALFQTAQALFFEGALDGACEFDLYSVQAKTATPLYAAGVRLVYVTVQAALRTNAAC